jgi:arsenite methyltransferase
VLKPGGRFAVSDVVVRGEVPETIRRSMNLWIGCVAGALSETEYLSKLQAAGFEGAAIEVTRVYSVEDAKEFLAGESEEAQELAAQVDGKFVSGFVRATKPVVSEPERPLAAAASGCCAGGGCCR